MQKLLAAMVLVLAFASTTYAEYWQCHEANCAATYIDAAGVEHPFTYHSGDEVRPGSVGSWVFAGGDWTHFP